MLATQCITACRHGQDNLKKFKRSIRTGKKRNQKLLVYWDFPTQLSLGFTENGAKKKKKGGNIQYVVILWEKMRCWMLEKNVQLNRKQFVL